MGITSTEKLYHELEIESQDVHFRKSCQFYKILNEKSPSYLRIYLFDA